VVDELASIVICQSSSSGAQGESGFVVCYDMVVCSQRDVLEGLGLLSSAGYT